MGYTWAMAKKQKKMSGVIQIQPGPATRDVIEAVQAYKSELRTLSTSYAACELIREAIASRERIAELEARNSRGTT